MRQFLWVPKWVAAYSPIATSGGATTVQPVPLNALNEAVSTLSALLQQSRQLMEQEELNPGARESLDKRIDETIETISSLLNLLKDAADRGAADKLISEDRDELAEP